jgi:hypothetical protein
MLPLDALHGRMQVNGAGAPKDGVGDCSALCPIPKDILCQIRNKCWKSLLSLSAGLVGLLAGGKPLLIFITGQSFPAIGCYNLRS